MLNATLILKFLEMKKHKNIYFAFILTLPLLLMSGCTDLDEEVFSEVLSDQYVPTENDIPSLIAPVYSVMRPLMADWQGYFDVQEEAADAIVTPARPNGWNDGGTYQRMHKHEWTAEQWQPWNLWLNCYNGINTANRVIYQIESGMIPINTDKDETAKDKLIAELRTVRAYYYSLLCDNHGNVPIVTDFSSKEIPTQSRQIDVYDFVVKELTECIPLLTETVNTETYGRFTKWAAKTLLAKVYLNAKFYSGKEEWDKCLALCEEVIQSGKYILEPSYKESFKTNNETSREIVFAIPYDETKGQGFIIHMKTLDPKMRLVYKMEAQPWGGNCAVPQFIDTYDPDDSRLKDTWIMGDQLNPSSGNVEITFTNSVSSIYATERNEGYRIGKFEIKQGAKSSLSNDFPVFRYAEVYLMKAECLLRTGNADAAAEIVTKIRERAFKSKPEKAVVTGGELMMGSKYNYGYATDNVVSPVEGGADIQFGRFLDELGWEFAAEAHRRQDLIRFGVFSTKTWLNHKPNGDDKKLFPIPLEELNKNPNLKQNPGY